MKREPTSPTLLKIEKDWGNGSITFRQLRKRLAAIGWEPIVRKGKVIGHKRVRFPEY